MNALIIHALYAAIAPWLALSLLLIGRNPKPSRTRIVASLVISFLLLLIPLSGWNSLAWLRLVEPNPSISFTALLAVVIIARLGRKNLFRSQDWKASWIFGACTSLILYPMGLGLTAIDPYGWGWGIIVPILTAIVASLLLLQDNRFGIVLLLTLLGMLVHPMESSNAWDCLIDPIYGIISLIVVLILIVQKMTIRQLH